MTGSSLASKHDEVGINGSSNTCNGKDDKLIESVKISKRKTLGHLLIF